MNDRAAALLEQALQLPLDEQTELAHRILAHAGEASEPLSPEWQEEIARRIAAFDAGEVDDVPLSEILARYGRA